jgi:ATP-binding cassette subfamily B protein
MKSETKTYKSYKSYLVHHLFAQNQKYLFIANLLGIFIIALARTLVPLTIGIIISDVVTGIFSNIGPLLLATLALMLLRSGGDYVSMMIGHRYGMKVEKNMRKEFFDIIQLKPLRYHDNARTGDLLALATNDLRVINTMVAHGSFFVFPFFQVVMTATALINTIDLRLALISIPFLILYIYFVLRFRKNIKPYASEQLTKHSKLATVFQDSITGAVVVKAFTAEDLERKKYRTAVQDFRKNWVGLNKVQARFFPLLVLYLLIGTTFLVSCLFVFENTLTIGSLTSINLLLITLIDPTNMVHWSTRDMLGGFAACSRLYADLTKEQVEEQTEKLVNWPENFQGGITFKNVFFRYENKIKTNPTVLKDISFHIEPKQKVAIVGPTGCGKTTLAKLILSLYEPQSGEILLDDENIKKYSLKVLRKHVGYIEQDIYLFGRSIRDNIAFGKPDATEEEILEAARLAQVDDFTKKFPNGYDTIVGERGTRLSGGEKQRIAIARAFLTDPEILMLDDSVSAIDSETEEKIGRAMENIQKNRTTLIITHRLHSIRTADKVILLKNGKLIAEGTHDELIKTHQDYRRIFGKQIELPELVKAQTNGGASNV